MPAETPAADSDLRVALPGPARGEPFTFAFDGRQVTAYPGESVGAALLAAGIRDLRRTRRDGQPRGLFCGIGLCFDCLVTVNGVPSQRACLVQVAPGDEVKTQDVADLA
jgi:hypothetical protein